MKNIILIFPLLAFEWEKDIGIAITIGWFKWTYSVTWKCTITADKTKTNYEEIHRRKNK